MSASSRHPIWTAAMLGKGKHLRDGAEAKELALGKTRRVPSPPGATLNCAKQGIRPICLVSPRASLSPPHPPQPTGDGHEEQYAARWLRDDVNFGTTEEAGCILPADDKDITVVE